MKFRLPILLFACILAFTHAGCNSDTDDTPQGPQLVFRFKFDPT